MLTMYVKTGCGFCALAISKAEELNLNVEYKNIADDDVVEELIKKGGKRQVPFLVHSECDVSMYESSDIVRYLDKYCGHDIAGTDEGEYAANQSCVCSLE